MDQHNTTPEHPALLAGKYTIEQEIGRGGMATVYRATRTGDAEPVAVKIMRREFATSVEAARFLREIELVRGMQHPHIVPVLDAGTHDGLPYYVMPLVRGETLRARMTREHQMPLDDALSITRDVAAALTHAHAHQVVHRDIKPENILLEHDRALVTDFGIARAITAEARTKLTSTGVSIGTIGYMSPEQATADASVDGRSDMYSLASVLYEMLSGELPHSGSTPSMILARQLSDEVRSLTPLRSSVTPSIDAAIRRALAHAPADRFATIEAFTTALSGPAPAAARSRTLWSRQRIAAVALGVAGVAWIGATLLGDEPTIGDGRLGIAVFPLRPLRAQDAQWSESLSDFLSTALDGVPGVRVPDPWSLWSDLRTQRSAPATTPDDITAERLAKRAGASRYVLGTVLESRGKVEVSLRVYAVGGGEPLAAITAAHHPDSIATLVQDLGSAVIAKLWGDKRPPGMPNIERNSTRSADALKSYLVARDALRRGIIDSAEAAITRAITIDTTFVLALLDATVISSWTQFLRGRPMTGLSELLQRAAASGDTLNERTRLRLRALQASVETEGTRAAEALEQVVRIDPTDVQAWSELAFVRLVYGWQFGVGVASAAEAADRALALDSSHVPTIATRLDMAIAALDSSTTDRLIARLRASDSNSAIARRYVTASHLLRAPEAVFRATIDTLTPQDDVDWATMVRTLRAYAPERLNALLARWRAVAGLGQPRRSAAIVAAYAAVDQGRLAETDSAIRAGALREHSGLDQFVNRAIVASSIAGVTDSVSATNAAMRMAQFMPIGTALKRFNTDAVWETAWTLAAWNAMYGDTVVSRQWHALIGTFPTDGTPRDWRAALRADIEARLAARRGDRGGALRLETQAYTLWAVHTNYQNSLSPEAAMRFTLAELLAVAGQTDSAAVLFGSLIPPGTYVGPYTVRSYYELGRIAESKSRRAEASRYYEMAARSWVNAGGEVRTWLNRAREGFARTSATAR
ncbi:MAG TPA: serine/threonine-protein kinase [Gemmatimonadaceae bacterium]|nr:serine/threonine-protein kinase [Gemmatimonadaceae bacterium]